MADRASRKEQCRVLYSQGLSLAKVAERVSLSEATVTRYKKQVKGTDQDWDKLRADLKGKTPAPRPNLVTFERPRGDKAKSASPSQQTAAGDLNLSDAMREGINLTLNQMRVADSGQGFGGMGNALVALGKFLVELESDEVALKGIMERYKNPRELARKMRELGWGRESA